MFLSWVLITFGIAAIVKWITRASTLISLHDALEILEERYAHGEIEREEFDQKKRDIKGSSFFLGSLTIVDMPKKESNMDTVDIMFHIHPDMPAEQRSSIEDALSAYDGVVSVHFSVEHAHELTVAYNPELISSEALLEKIRQWDEAATRIGL